MSLVIEFQDAMEILRDRRCEAKLTGSGRLSGAVG